MRMPACVLRALSGAVVFASCLALTLSFSSNVACAQDSQSSSSSSLSQSGSTGRPEAAMPVPGANGGGAFTDYSQLLTLITQTIDPEDWDPLYGGLGTGTNKLVQYPNGVWLDAKGHFNRMNRGALSSLSSVPQKWKSGSGLRTISLKALDNALGMTNSQGLVPGAQMANLAGITHIQYIAIDMENRDVLISGPAVKGNNNNGFLLEDLRTLAALMNKNTAPLGCSLEPNNQGIAEAIKFLSDPKVIARLGRTPQAVADQIKAKVGSHAVDIFGIDKMSRTAMAMVDADEHMKRVGLGLEVTSPRIKTYFEHLDRAGKAPTESLIRWWFAYNPESINASAAGDLFELPENVVAVLSEEQWMNARGERKATGGNDAAADAFAAEMTAKFRQLCATEPAYARLEGIFELGLALQISIEASKQPSLAEWFPNLAYRQSDVQVEGQAPKSVDGVTAWDRLKNGTVVAVISGGVKLEPSAMAGRGNWNSKDVTRPASLNSAASSQANAAQWWWD